MQLFLLKEKGAGQPFCLRKNPGEKDYCIYFLFRARFSFLKEKGAGEGNRTLERTNRLGSEPSAFDRLATPAL